MACLFHGLDGSSEAVVDVLSLGASLSVRRFPHHASLPSLSLRTSFASYFAQLRSVRACSGSSLQLHSIWSLSLGLQFGSLRIGIFTVCFGLYSFRSSLSVKAFCALAPPCFVHEFDCELILCRVPLIWVRRCHSSLLIHRFGASLEVPDTLGFGSSLSFSRIGSSVSDGFVAVCIGQCFLGIVSLSSQFCSTRCVFICAGGSAVGPLIIVGFSRVGDSLSLFGSARCGSSLAVLGHTPGFVFIALLERDWARRFPSIFLPDRVLDGRHCGATPALRNFTWFEPFAGSHFATCGSSISLLGMSRFAASSSVIDFSVLGASVSFNNFHGLGASFMSRILGGFEVLRVGQLQRSVACGPVQPCVKRVWVLLGLG